MADQIKSGKEVLDDFFKDISNIKDVDADLAASISRLYQEGKLSNVNITNELLRLREAKIK
jgi:hypothetical protein